MMNSSKDNGVNKDRLLVDIYAELGLLPLQLANIIEKYDSSITTEAKNNERQKKALEDKKNGEEKDLSGKKEQRKRILQSERSAQVAEQKEIANRLQEIEKQMDEVNKDYIAVGNLLQHNNARGKMYASVLEIMQMHDGILNEYEELKREVEAEMQTIVNESYFEEENVRADREYNRDHSKLLSAYVNAKKKSEEEYTRRLGVLRTQLTEQIERLQPNKVQKDREKCMLQIPLNAGFQLAKTMPNAVCIANCALDLAKFKGNEATSFAANTVSDYFDFSIEMKKGKKYLTFPYGQSFSSETFNKILEYDFESREMALECLSAIEMRMFQSIPAGKLRVTMFDPIDLGKDFSLFSVLGENDDRIISTKIWHETDRMKEKLKDLVTQISHVNQDCLQGIYRNIVEYNKVVGKNAEPLQALFIADFSDQFFDVGELQTAKSDITKWS